MYRVQDIARYIINYSYKKEYVTSNLKLQKLLYLVQSYFLMVKQEPCFSEKIRAWDFGPVVPEVYREYVKYGACMLPPVRKYYVGTRKFEYTDAIIDEDDKKLINQVLDKFADYSSTQLVTLTQHQNPWIDAYIPRANNEITKKAIESYFRED